MSKSKPNPDYNASKALEAQASDQWVIEVRRKLSDQIGSTQVGKYRSWFDRNRSKKRYGDREDLKEAYWQGLLLRKIKGSYDQFLDRIFRLVDYHWYGTYRDRTPAKKYVRNIAHQKKNALTDKKVWREFRKLDQDKRDPNYGKRKRKVYMVKYSHRSYRRYIKRKIIKGDWEAMHNMDVKAFYDPWLWY